MISRVAKTAGSAIGAVNSPRTVEADDAMLPAKIDVQAHKVADFNRRLGQIDSTIEEAARTHAAMQLAADQRRNRAELVTARVRQGKVLADLQVEKAGLEGQRKVADADLGPARYLATLLGADDQDVLRWFILTVAVLLDPAAVLLLLAARRR